MSPSRIRPAFVVWILAMLVLVLSGWVLLPFPRRPTGTHNYSELLDGQPVGLGVETEGALPAGPP